VGAGRGGIESHTADLARELAARGHRISALVLDYTGKSEPYGVTCDFVGPVHVTRMSYTYHDHKGLAQVVRNRKAEEVAAIWLHERQPSLVHVHHLTGFGMGVLPRLRGEGATLVMTLHDYWPLCPRGQMVRHTEEPLDAEICGGLNPAACGACLASSFPHLMPSRGAQLFGPYDGPSAPDGEPVDEPVLVEPGADPDAAVADRRTAFAIESLRCADLLVTPSTRTREIYTRACAAMGLDGSTIRVVENGINIKGLRSDVKRLRRERPAEQLSSSPVLGVVGSVLPSKGVLELAMAFAEAQQAGRFERAGGLRMEIHGNLPAYHGETAYVDALCELEAKTEGLDVCGPFFHWELPRILARLEGVAAPSRWEEVFGLTVREARAAGLAVLVSDVGDLPAVTAGGRAGLVVEPPHGESGRAAWGDALQQFVEDVAKRREWARYKALPRTSKAMALELERLYAGLRPRR
jgi:glycosyltransferase involved in cell wall biosynthesis